MSCPRRIRLRVPLRLPSVPALLALLVLSALPSAAGADTPEAASAPGPGLDPASATAEQIVACMRSNLPQADSAQTAEFVSVDRLEQQRESRARIYGRRREDGSRDVLTRFSRPADVRGSEFLLNERDGRNEMFLFTAELGKAKRISGRAMAGSLFGTDFSYEDFERLQGLSRPETSQRLPDEKIGERDVFVIETRPVDRGESAYSAVRSYVDRETCVALKTESFERKRLRKVLTVEPDDIVRSGDAWVPTSMVMRDLRDRTHTTLVLDRVEVDAGIDGRRFTVGRLGRNRD